MKKSLSNFFSSFLAKFSLIKSKIVKLARLPALAFIIASLLFGGYWLTRFALAQYFSLRADQAGQNNQMVEMYQLQQKMIDLYPYSARHHRRYALTNLALAIALLDKAELSNAEKAQAAQLTQQSLREARVATQLQPRHAPNWQTLAQIYAQLIGVVDGADKWAVSSYTQAIKLKPADPDLRTALGEVFYQLDLFSPASQLFTQALELKPSLFKARYGLAQALVEQNQLAPAIDNYQQALLLLDPTSKDYRDVNDQIIATQTKLDQQQHQSDKK